MVREKKNFKCDIDPTLTNVSNGTSTRDREQFCQIILKSIPFVEVMVRMNSDGRTHASTETRTHIRRTVVVTTVSRSPQAGSTKTLIYLTVCTNFRLHTTRSDFSRYIEKTCIVLPYIKNI